MRIANKEMQIQTYWRPICLNTHIHIMCVRISSKVPFHVCNVCEIESQKKTEIVKANAKRSYSLIIIVMYEI